MSGNADRLLVDTNTMIYALGNRPEILHRLERAEWVGMSIISYIEFLSFQGLSAGDDARFRDFAKNVDVVTFSATESITDMVIDLRKRTKLKLPDAIVAATAISTDSTLLTADRRLLSVPGCRTEQIELP